MKSITIAFTFIVFFFMFLHWQAVEGAYAPDEADIEVSTDKLSYKKGDILTIKGNGAHSYTVSIKIISPTGEDITKLKIIAGNRGEFSTAWIIPELEEGEYTIKVWDIIQQAQTKFHVGTLNQDIEQSSDYKKIVLPSKLQEILDENDIANLPSWIQKIIEWHNQGMISETELINAINYLNTKSSEEIISQVEKTKLRLNDIKSIRFNGGMPIVFSGNLSTESEFIPNAEILIVGDGPCPANGIISKGFTGKFGRYNISTEAMIWDPSDNSIKIHAEYLGNEIYLPSSSQEEVIVVYPTKDTKSC